MNKYTPYHEPSARKAKELCVNLKTLPERYEMITDYISRTISYDYIRAITITKKNGLPDVDRCFNRRMGICLDIAALAVNMLRAVSVPCNLVIGWADGKYHAWVVARMNGKRYLYDHDDPNGKVQVYKKERMY